MTQPDSLITVPEGDPLELRCNYSSSFSPYLFWYMQYPNQGLQLLLKYVSGNPLVKGTKGFEAEFRKNETSFHLRKTSVHLSDSAKYFCALSDTVTETAGGAEHKHTETQQLKKPSISACVIFRKLVCYLMANSTDNTEFWRCFAPMGIIFFSFLFFILQMKTVFVFLFFFF